MDIEKIKELYGSDTEIRQLEGIQIETPEGFKDVKYIKRVKVSGYYFVSLSNGDMLEASETHKVRLADNHWSYVCELEKGTELQGGVVVLEDPKFIEEDCYLYDFLDVEGSVYLTCNGVVNHNCAFIDNIEETYAAAQQTLATGGQSMLLSTPNGVGNFFYKTWVKAENGENTFFPIKLPWTVHPERNQEWRDKQDKDLGKRFASQECVGPDTIVEITDLEGKEQKIRIEDLHREYKPGYLIKSDYNTFEPFRGVRKVSKNHYFELITVSGRRLQASGSHLLLNSDGEWKAVKDLKVGDRLTGYRSAEWIVSIVKVNKPITLYDALEVGKKHVYLTNNFVSHNCDCNFLTSGNTVIEPELLNEIEKETIREPDDKRGFDGNLWIWLEPDYTRSYLITADVARGDGEDYSACHVFDVETCEQVAEYKGQLGPRDYGRFLLSLGKLYNTALVSVENASIGWSTIEELIEQGYPNLYYGTSNTFETVESYNVKWDKDKLTPGFTNSARTRPILVAKIIEYIEGKSCTLHSKRLLSELRTFIWGNGGKAEAAQGFHDDLVMAFGQALYIRDTALKMRRQGQDLIKNSIDSFLNLNKRDPSFYTAPRVTDPYKMTIGNNQQIDFSWVLG